MIEVDFNQINYNFSFALDEASQAQRIGEVPVGAVIEAPTGKIIARGLNQKEQNLNACLHAEIVAISEASKVLGDWRLNNCSLYVTLEPCPMCMGAIIQSRLKNVYFGAYDLKGGAISLGFNIHQSNKLNHRVRTYGGFKHLECSKMLSDFFRKKRKNYI